MVPIPSCKTDLWPGKTDVEDSLTKIMFCYKFYSTMSLRMSQSKILTWILQYQAKLTLLQWELVDGKDSLTKLIICYSFIPPWAYEKYNTKHLWLQEHLILIIVCQNAFFDKTPNF